MVQQTSDTMLEKSSKEALTYRQDMLEKRFDGIEQMLHTIIEKLDQSEFVKKAPKLKEELIYDRLEKDLEIKHFGEIVAIDLEQEKMVGHCKSVIEAYKMGLKNSNEKRFYFRKVGFPGID